MSQHVNTEVIFFFSSFKKLRGFTIIKFAIQQIICFNIITTSKFLSAV